MSMTSPNASPAGRLVGKVAIITGAGTGIGRAAALLFAEEGATVVLAEISGPAGEDAATEIMTNGSSAIFVQTDVTDAASVEACVDRTLSCCGRLDIVYNNAGGSSPEDGKVTDVSPEVYARAMALNLHGTWLFCHYAIPAMIRSGGGSLINTSSGLAVGMQAGGRHAYSAAKGGVLSLTRAIAFDYAHERVRANAIVPGFTTSERVARDLAAHPQLNERISAQHPLGYGHPHQVAHLALYLASDESAQTTGQMFAVNNEVTG